MINFYKTLIREIGICWFIITKDSSGHQERMENTFGILIYLTVGLLPAVLTIGLLAMIF